MSTFIDYIRIKNNNNNEDDFLHPITKEKAVIDDNGVRLDYKISSIIERCENVEKKIYLVQTAKGTPNEIILDNIELVNGFYTNFVILENNDGLTTINGKPLYKPNTYQSPTLIKGEAVTAWYDATNDCFFIKDSDINIELPDNLVYFSNDDPELSSPIPRDSDLLGGEPRSYYEQLIQDVADRVTANLNSINVLNNKLTLTDVQIVTEQGYTISINTSKKFSKIVVVNIAITTSISTPPDVWTNVGKISNSANYPAASSTLLYGKINNVNSVFDASVLSTGIIRIRPHGAAINTNTILAMGGTYSVI